MNQLPFFCIATRYYQPMYEKFFLPCFENPKQCIAFDQPEIYGNRLGTPEFKKAIKFKLQKIIETLKNNELVVWSDVDLIFPQGVDVVTKDLLERIKNYDMLVSKEYRKKNINSGFFIVRSNKKTLELFQKLLGRVTKLNTTEQGEMQFLLRKLPLNWQTLPIEYWNLTIGFPVPKNPLMIHVNLIKKMNCRLKGENHLQRKMDALRILSEKYQMSIKKDIIEKPIKKMFL